jgi:ribosomal protein L7/L12
MGTNRVSQSKAQEGMADVQRALQAGHKIEAIRLMRELTGVGLKEAKDQVDAMERVMPASASSMGAAGLAPGEVRRRGSAWWIAAIVLAAVLGWYLMR